MKPRHQAITLIASKSFKVGDDVIINKLGFQTKIHLTKIIETTGEFNQFEFNVQKVIGMESDQKAAPAKDFDSVWTLI